MDFKAFAFLTIILSCWHCRVSAQATNGDLIENILETIAEDGNEADDYGEFTERLSGYQSRPINLNKATSSQLAALPFLNPLQVNSLFKHIEKNGKLIDPLELQGIDGFDLETIKKLLHFADIKSAAGFENFSFRKLFQEGNNDLLLRYGNSLNAPQVRKSDSHQQNDYLGSPEKMRLRYRFNYGSSIQFSLNADKDAGEKIWTNTKKSKGPDFTSSSLFLRELGRFRKIVLGDYTLQFGQGLTMWSGLSFGKGADIFAIAKQDQGLRPYTSANEFSFLRGLATEIALNERISFTPFISHRQLDASTKVNGETKFPEISNLQQTGLHRTVSELNNQKRVSQKIVGGNLQYRFKRLEIGFTAYHSRYSLRFAKGTKIYDRFRFAHSRLNNLGSHYSYSFKNSYIFGEAAHSLGSGFSFLNGIMSSLSASVSIVMLYRKYQKDYHSFFNEGIAESSHSVNENGVLGGLRYASGRKYELICYTDIFRFPWLNFGTAAPSSGFEILSQFVYSPTKATKLVLRYKIEEKAKSVKLSKVFRSQENTRKQNYRLEIHYRLNRNWNCRNRAEMVRYYTESSSTKQGFLIYQDLFYRPIKSRLTGNIRFAIFDTDSHDARIYAYESDVLYGHSIPGFQNSGTRIYLNGRYKLKKGIDCWIKCSLSKLRQQDDPGPIQGMMHRALNREIKLQLRYQF